MTTQQLRPIPELTDADTSPYWEAARQHRLALMRCDETGRFIHPPGPGSPYTGSDRTSWVDLGSNITGRLYSYIVPHRAFLPGFGDAVPYIVGLADVDQAPGVRITANVLGVAWQDVEIGRAVRMTWVDVSDTVALPQWEVV